MKNSEYQAIVSNISEQINNCESALAQYHSCSQDFSKMSIVNINETISSCRKVQGDMDKLVTSDLYHIVGMANLNAAQTSKVIKLTKTLLQYRSDIKFFANQNTITVPKRKDSKYKTSFGVELVKLKGD